MLKRFILTAVLLLGGAADGADYVAALACTVCAWAGEPAKTPDALLVLNFHAADQADYAAGSPRLELHGAASTPGRWGDGLKTGPGQYLLIPSQGNLDPKEGTLMFWFKPAWSSPDARSHTLLSWRWDDGKGGYGVLSCGWWEPAGAGRTYFVFENQLYLHCNSPVTYRRDRWMHFILTWKFGKRLAAALYVDGERAAAVMKPAPALPQLKGPVCLGGDVCSPLRKGRWADGVFDALVVLRRALTEEEAREEFRRQEPNWRRIEAARNAWLFDVLKQPYKPLRDAQGRVLESRAVLDEGTGWVSADGARRTVDKLTRAGFNVFIPCVWHGRGARWPSRLTPMEPGVAKTVKAERGDPLRRLVRLCHARGVEVHPWFCVCYGDRRWKPLQPYIEPGTPPRACEAHNPKFRRFIVDLMMEVVSSYDVDGLNLDYIRTKGLSKSASARESFRRRFGVDLLDALKRADEQKMWSRRIALWQRDAITDIVRSVAARARAAKPRIVISIDGHPRLPSEPISSQGRDGLWWAQQGLIDVLYSMDYGRRLSWERADAVRRALPRPAALVTIVGNYERTPKGVVPRDAKLVADLIAFCQRRSRGNGVALYLLSMLDDAQIAALREGPFREPARPHWVRAAPAQ